MGINKKEMILILVLFLLVVLSMFMVRHVGYVIQTTFSQVRIDQGIKVYADEFDGDTFDFLRMNDTELEDISSMILEETSYGKIVFSENINLTQDVVNIIINLDSGVEISDNFVDINTTALTSLEKSATIYLYGLTFENPRVLRNGVVCPASICQEISYSGGILEFTTTSFSNYSAEETSVEGEVVVPSVGGGGGGSGVVMIPNFILDKDLIKVLVKQGSTVRETVEIINTGSLELNFTIDSGEMGRFMVTSESSFVLQPGKVKIINVDIFAREDEVPDAYVGRMIVKSGGVEKIINVIVEVKERNPLFDIRTEVLDKKLKRGGSVVANISMVNMGDLRDIDVLLYYSIRNFENEVFLFREESLAVDKDLSVLRGFDIGDEFSSGEYVFYSRVSYGNISAASVDTFSVENSIMTRIREFRWFVEIVIALLVLIIIILSIIIYIIYRRFNLWNIFKKGKKKRNLK